LTRRELVKLGGAAAATAFTRGLHAEVIPLFDGRSLDGWIQSENGATVFAAAGITDPAAFAAKLSGGQDAVSILLRARLTEPVRNDLAAFTASNTNARAAITALVKELNQFVSGSSIYDTKAFHDVPLRPETAALLQQNPTGLQLARLNKLLIEEAYPGELAKSSTTGWEVRDGAMCSTGAGRGVIYTAKDYDRFRLTFTMRHVSGNPDHQACVLIFCTRPKSGERPLDALAGIQLQPPNGGRWDYRPGMNNNGGAEFTKVNPAQFDPHAWSTVEILADASQGVARMAVAQPPGTKAIEVLSFKDPTAGKVGPIAWQMHNAGLFDEYKDVSIEPDPKTKDLISVK
jgi:hypothetical protein